MKTEVNLPFTLNFPVPNIVVGSLGVLINLILTATLRWVHVRSRGRGREGEPKLSKTFHAHVAEKQIGDEQGQLSIM